MLWDPFPAKATAMLRYAETITLAPTAGVPDTYIFRANSIFDPDYSGVGHQPYGHDTYQSIYNHYKVNYATIVITPMDSSAGTLGCSITDDTTVSGSYTGIKETKGTRMIPLNGGVNIQPGKVIQYYNKNQVFAPDVDGTGANFGANPSEGAYFHVWFTAKNQTASASCAVNVQITYNVTMWELKDLGLS